MISAYLWAFPPNQTQRTHVKKQSQPQSQRQEDNKHKKNSRQTYQVRMTRQQQQRQQQGRRISTRGDGGDADADADADGGSSNGSKQRGPKNGYNHNRIHRGNKGNNSRGQKIKVKQKIKSIESVGTHSIHSLWKQQLGGLIRWYLHQQTTAIDNNDDNNIISMAEAEAQVERMCYQSQCSVEGTRDAILKALSLSSGETLTNWNKDCSGSGSSARPSWIQLSMVISYDQLNEEEMQQAKDSSYECSCDNKGFLLPVTEKPGEGPAHLQERWEYVMVPKWAVLKLYYFQVNNNSPLPMSCKMSIDSNIISSRSNIHGKTLKHMGDNAAKNAPVPPHCERTIKPADHRYFQAHNWVLTPAKKN